MMNALEQQVIAESKRFRAALPRLLPQYWGKWVVFKDGEVQGVFDDAESAYIDAIDSLGIKSGFVISQVVEDEGPVPVSASLWFGLFPT
jgi:hypothetical protein